MSERAQKSRGGTRLVILGAALACGILAAVATARSRHDPYVGVYRQAAVGVVADRSGTITELVKRHGDLVHPGDPIAQVSMTPPADSLSALAQRRQEIKRELESASDQATVKLALQGERVGDEQLDIQLRQADLLRARLKVRTLQQALRDEAQGTAKIVATAAGTDSQTSIRRERTSLRLKMADAINREQVLDTQIQLCEDRLAALTKFEKNLPQKIRDSLGIDRLEQELAETMAELKSSQTTQSARHVTSPAHGRIGIWRAAKGDHVSSGQTLVEIFDVQRPFILLRVPVSELLELTVGREVRVTFDGITTKKPLHGTISEVRSEAECRADSARVPGATQATVRVTPTGRLWPTPPPGATAKIYLE